MEDRPTKSIGDRIRSARGYRGLAQAELARRLQMSKTSLSLIETGQTKNPGSSIVREIARILDVNANFLLGLSDKIEGEFDTEEHEAATAQLVRA